MSGVLGEQSGHPALIVAPMIESQVQILEALTMSGYIHCT